MTAATASPTIVRGLQSHERGEGRMDEKELDLVLSKTFSAALADSPILAQLMRELVVAGVLTPPQISRIFARARGFIMALEPDQRDLPAQHGDSVAELLRPELAELGHENVPPRYLPEWWTRHSGPPE